MKLYMFRTVPLSIIRSFSLYTQQWYMSYRFADSLRAGWSSSQAVSKPVWQIPLLCVQWKTDDGQRYCPKHVEFDSKNKFEKLVHLFGFIIRNVISVVTRLQALPSSNRCSNPARQNWFTASPKLPYLPLGPAQPPTQWVPAAVSTGVKQLGREAEHLVRTLRMIGDIMSGDIMSGDIIPLRIRLCSLWITSHFIFYGYRIWNRNTKRCYHFRRYPGMSVFTSPTSVITTDGIVPRFIISCKVSTLWA